MWRNKEQATYGEKMIKCIRQHGAKLLYFEKHAKEKNQRNYHLINSINDNKPNHK